MKLNENHFKIRAMEILVTLFIQLFQVIYMNNKENILIIPYFTYYFGLNEINFLWIFASLIYTFYKDQIILHKMESLQNINFYWRFYKMVNSKIWTMPWNQLYFSHCNANLYSSLHYYCICEKICQNAIHIF